VSICSYLVMLSPDRAALPPFLFVFDLTGREFLPLHIAGDVRTASTQRDDVVYHVAWAFASRLAGGWAGIFHGEGAAFGCAARIGLGTE